MKAMNRCASGILPASDVDFDHNGRRPLGIRPSGAALLGGGFS